MKISQKMPIFAQKYDKIVHKHTQNSFKHGNS